MGGLPLKRLGNEAERPTRLLSRGALAEKVNVLPEAATGLPCPTGKKMCVPGCLAKILLHPLPLSPAEDGRGP